MAFGPAKVIHYEWQIDRTAAHRDFQEAWKRMRRSFGSPDEASNFYDLYTAMMMIGGEYAAPFMEACNRFGEAATFVFPWLAHLALTTDRPVDSYVTLTEACGRQLADKARETLTGSQIPIDERYESTMLRLATTAHTALLKTLPGDSMLGLTTYSRSRLTTNPSQAATFQRVFEAARALATTKTVREIARRWGWDERSRDGLFIEGLHLLEKLMATPGMHGSHPLLQLTGLAPAIGYSNGDFLPLGMVWQTSGLAKAKELSEETLNELDLVRTLMNAASRRATSDEERLIAALSAETQARWDAFVQAERGTDRYQRER